MSRLDELIAELCPGGVEYKKLGDIISVERGKRVVREQLPPDGKFCVFQNSLSPLGYINETNYPANTTFIIGAGAAGEVGYSFEDFWAADDCFPLMCTDQYNARFLYHLLLSFKGYIASQVRRGSIPRLSRSVIENLKIPTPPLQVQCEIVRILDKFTELAAELTAELTAELAARQKQYEFYRDQLFRFVGPNAVWRTLGDIGKVCMCKRIMKDETSSDGEIPFFKIGTFGKTPDAYISRELFERYSQQYSYPKKGDVLISAAGTIGKTVVFDGEPSYFQDSNIVWVDNDENQVTNEFLFYWYQTGPWRASAGGTIARLYNDNISGARVPVLPKDQQKRIVRVLKAFDSICSDLTSGLPAEIAARQKQYEYYRDKLLTFKEKAQ